jgi:hypothetical protein
MASEAIWVFCKGEKCLAFCHQLNQDSRICVFKFGYSRVTFMCNSVYFRFAAPDFWNGISAWVQEGDIWRIRNNEELNSYKRRGYCEIYKSPKDNMAGTC